MNENYVIYGIVIITILLIIIILLYVFKVIKFKKSNNYTPCSSPIPSLPPFSTPSPFYNPSTSSPTTSPTTSSPTTSSPTTSSPTTSSPTTSSPTTSPCVTQCGCDYGFSYAYNQMACSSNNICQENCPYCIGYIYNNKYGTCQSTSAVKNVTVYGSDGTTGTCVYVPIGSDLVLMSLSFSCSGGVNMEYITMPSGINMSTSYPSVFTIYCLRGGSSTWFLANSNANPLYVQGQFNNPTQLYFYNANVSSSSGPTPQTYNGGGGFYATGIIYLSSSYNTTTYTLTGNDNQNITSCLYTPVSVDCVYISLLINQGGGCNTNSLTSNSNDLNLNSSYLSILPIHGMRGNVTGNYAFFSNSNNSYLSTGNEGWGLFNGFCLYKWTGGHQYTYTGGGGLFGNGMVLLAKPSQGSMWKTTSINSSITVGFCQINSYCGYVWINCNKVSNVSSIDISSLITNAGSLTGVISVIPIYAFSGQSFTACGFWCNAQGNPSPIYANCTPDSSTFYIYNQNWNNTEGAVSSSLGSTVSCIATGMIFL